MKYPLIKVIFIISFTIIHIPIHANKITYWNTQRAGTNQFNKNPTLEEWYKEAKENNISWVRLAWGKRKNFLMGNDSNYQGLVKKDLEELKQSIKYAEKYDLKIVLVPIALPGAQYRQLQNYKHDIRLWQDKKYWKMTAQFWQDIAVEFKDNATVVAYNIFNEPYPELKTDSKEHTVVGKVDRFKVWYEKHQGSSRDLQLFYKTVIEAIRKVDTQTPIMVESGWYAQANTFVHWTPFKDDNILYQFHMYEPYAFTSSKNFSEKKNYTYPGTVPFGENMVYWDKNTMKNYFDPFFTWIEKNNIPSNRIVAGEFGCMRRNTGCANYLSDLLELLNNKKFHWAFYSFREDEWDGYDYQLGTEGFSWEYWKKVEKGETPDLPYNNNNTLWQIIQNGLDTVNK